MANTAHRQWVVTIAVMLATHLGCNDVSAPRESMTESGPLTVRLTGGDLAWHVQYTGPDGEFETADDVHVQRDIYCPAGRSVRIELTSDDLLYTFAVEECGINELAVPGQVFVVEVYAKQPQRISFAGDQLCGFAHEELFGQIVIQSESEFQDWLRRHVVENNRTSLRL